MSITVGSVSTFDSGVQQGANLIAAGDQAPNTGPCVTNMKRAGATLGTSFHAPVGHYLQGRQRLAAANDRLRRESD
jgi:hypothetical protein